MAWQKEAAALKVDDGDDLAQQGSRSCGADTLRGGNGSDKLSGGEGDDALTGGKARDMLTGGSGADDFIFVSGVNESVDRITDFEDGLDSIVVIGGDFDSVEINSANGGRNTRIDFDDGTKVLLQNVNASLIGEDDFSFI